MRKALPVLPSIESQTPSPGDHIYPQGRGPSCTDFPSPLSSTVFQPRLIGCTPILSLGLWVLQNLTCHPLLFGVRNFPKTKPYNVITMEKDILNPEIVVFLFLFFNICFSFQESI